MWLAVLMLIAFLVNHIRMFAATIQLDDVADGNALIHGWWQTEAVGILTESLQQHYDGRLSYSSGGTRSTP